MKKEEKEKTRSRREKLASYFFNLSQLTFAALVLGGVAPIFKDFTEWMNYWSVTLGCALTLVFASLANRILKY